MALRHAASRARTAGRRGYSSAAVVELREYNLKPEAVLTYGQVTADTADLRRSLVPLRLFSQPETGGVLNVATHLYYYEGGVLDRDAKRAVQAQNADWQAYLDKSRPCVDAQKSTIFVEAPLVGDPALGLSGLGLESQDQAPAPPTPAAVIYELRRYRLRLGYEIVPRFLELYGAGLPSKLAAPGTDPGTSLCTVLYSDIAPLNEVIELWRHAAGSRGMMQSRAAARGAGPWRSAIAEIAGLANEFTTTIHKPTPYSNWH